MKKHKINTFSVNGTTFNYFYKRDRRNKNGNRIFRTFVFKNGSPDILEILVSPPVAIVTEEDIINEIQKHLTTQNTTEPAPLRVCEHCLMAIESREGQQITRKIYVDEDDPQKCDWCETDDNDILYEIL